MLKQTCRTGVNQKIYSLKENGKIYKCFNEAKLDSESYQVDGCIFVQETSCDFLLVDNHNKRLFFIECKGIDVNKAYLQIEETIKKMKSITIGFEVNARVVCSNNRVHTLNGTGYKALLKSLTSINGSYKQSYIITKSSLLEERIS